MEHNYNILDKLNMIKNKIISIRENNNNILFEVTKMLINYIIKQITHLITNYYFLNVIEFDNIKYSIIEKIKILVKQIEQYSNLFFIDEIDEEIDNEIDEEETKIKPDYEKLNKLLSEKDNLLEIVKSLSNIKYPNYLDIRNNRWWK